MDRKIIFDEALQLLETLKEQTEALQQYDGPLPGIEIDIILSNIRELYEKLRDIDKLEKIHAPAEKILVQQVKHEPPQKEKQNVPVIDEKPVTDHDMLEFEKNMIVESINQYTMLAEPPVVEQKEKTAPTESPKKLKPLKKSAPDLFTADSTGQDKPREDKKSLNDVLSESAKTKILASKLQKNPIKDLKTAIGINEKFMFINELFEGSLQKYNEHINSLNTQANKEDAMKIMDALKSEYSWKKDSDAFLAIADLIERRYQ